MKHGILFTLFVFLFSTALVTSAQDKGKAKINIKRTENGATQEYDQEIDLEEGQTLEEILEGLEIWQEFSQLEGDESIELNIKKILNGEDVEDLDFTFYYEDEGKPFLGVMIKDAENGSGAYITEIIEGTAAEEVGLQAGDIITEVDGEPISDMSDLIDGINAHEVGEDIRIKYIRDGNSEKTKAELGKKEESQLFDNHFEYKFKGCDEEGKIFDFDFGDGADDRTNWFEDRERDQNSAFLGVTPSYNTIDRGVQLGYVVEKSSAEEMGIQEGDIVYSMNGTEVNSFSELGDVISSVNAGDAVTLKLNRNGSDMEVSGNIGSKADQEKEKFYFKKRHGDHNGNGDKSFFEGNMDEDGFKGMNFFNSEESSFLGVSPSCGDKDLEGVKLGSITGGSSAEKMGLQTGDIVSSFNGKSVSNFDDLSDFIGQTKPGDQVALEVMRDGAAMTISGEMGKRSYSSCEDVKFFQDFKGMDEDGVIFYDLEFDGEEEEMQERIEEMTRALEDKLAALHEREMAMNQREREVRSAFISIELDQVTEDDLEQVNSGNDAEIDLDNDLPMENIAFFPNPSNGEFNLRFDLPNEGELLINLFNQYGKMIYSERIGNFSGIYQNSIDLSGEADGSYYLQIIQNDKSYTKKLIKNS